MPEVPAHEKVLVSPEYLANDPHGDTACEECHGGDPSGETRAEAHVGLIADPSADPGTSCGQCHGGIAAAYGDSLHATLGGMRHAIATRAGVEHLSGALDTAFRNHCGKCHATCGNCHISVPASAGGGLLKGHQFRKTPPMTRTCTACHGSRVGDEYRGLNSGCEADVHYNRGMQCTDCHTGAEMHNQGAGDPPHRYAVENGPRCEQCHPDDDAFQEQTAHAMHRDTEGQPKVACQVCHAGPYKHCYGCHVSLEDDKPVYEVNAPSHESVLDFKIGRNPLMDALHPETWAVLRHAPIAPTNFEFYGEDLLPAFDTLPTWRLATPHSIQRATPQNESCGACHGVRELFLGPDDLEPYEIDANQSVLVDEPPGP